MPGTTVSQTVQVAYHGRLAYAGNEQNAHVLEVLQLPFRTHLQLSELTQFHTVSNHILILK